MDWSLFWYVLIFIIAFMLGKSKAYKTYKTVISLYDRALKGIEQDSNYLYTLIEWKEELERERDEAITNYLNYKKRPARKAADEVKFAKSEVRSLNKQLAILKNRLYTYEAFAPWLAEYEDIPTRELVSILKNKKEVIERNFDDEEISDPASKYVTSAEWQKLKPSERHQLALDRYLDKGRKKDLWSLGIDYERYIGFKFESKKYNVIYNGAISGKGDMGIDLICENKNEVIIIQCKRLSEVKGIPIRENVIAQLYGSMIFYSIQNPTNKPIRAAIFTSYELSDDARKFAHHLGIEINEGVKLEDYPMIKCNVSSKGEKIYHLPMDQQYDKIVIDSRKKEFYAESVKEAEKQGFRRAFKWSGNS